VICPKIPRWYHEDAVTKFVAEAIEDATMDAERDFSLHLKRTYVTGMVDLKVPPHVVELVVNHISGIRVGVAGLYNKAELIDERCVAFARWSAHVQGLVSGRPANVVPLVRRRK
jgi:hypothetical protein